MDRGKVCNHKQSGHPMVTVGILKKYKDVLNMKRLAEAAGVSYSTLVTWLNKPDDYELKLSDMTKLDTGLKKLGVQLIEPEG